MDGHIRYKISDEVREEKVRMYEYKYKYLAKYAPNDQRFQEEQSEYGEGNRFPTIQQDRYVRVKNIVGTWFVGRFKVAFGYSTTGPTTEERVSSSLPVGQSGKIDVPSNVAYVRIEFERQTITPDGHIVWTQACNSVRREARDLPACFIMGQIIGPTCDMTKC
jgi:hypothetical protein